jgi:hypothetical protein
MLMLTLTQLKVGLKLLYGKAQLGGQTLFGYEYLQLIRIFDESSIPLCSELNETVAEAQMRTRQVPPNLPSQTTIQHYMRSKNRLIILVIIFFLLPLDNYWEVIHSRINSRCFDS